MIWVVKAGKAVGYYLSRGSGSGFGGLLVGDLFCRSSLRFGSGSADCKIVLGWKGQGGLSGSDNEDLFELVQIGCWSEFDECVWLMVGIGCDGLNGADGEAPGIDLVAARGEDLLANLDA